MKFKKFFFRNTVAQVSSTEIRQNKWQNEPGFNKKINELQTDEGSATSDSV